MTAAPEPSPDAAAAFERLQLARRADWRFLLPTPRLGTVAYAGRRDDELMRALRALAGSLVPLDSTTERARACDVAVAVDPSREDLRRLAGVLRPGGSLYVELHGRLAAARRLRAPSLRALERKLARLGFEDVRVRWHFPSLEAPDEIVPLAGGHAVRHAFGRRRATALVRAKAMLARALLSARAFAPAVQARSVTARRAGGAGRGQDYLFSLLAEDDAGAALSPDAAVLVTPRDRSSKFVVFLLLDRRSGEPRRVAKIARLAEHADPLAREAELLDAVQQARPGGYDTIPRPVALAERDGHLVLVETALAGRAIDYSTLRRRRAECVPAVLAWIDELPRFPHAAADEPAWYARLVEEPLALLGEALAGEGESRALVERTGELLDPLRDADVPLVVEHGDVNHPNLIWLRDGRAGVVDWERARLRGLPAQDLFFFLAYVAFAAEGAWDDRARRRAFHESFFVPEAWTLAAIAPYAERAGVPAELLRPLFVACWARQTAGLVERVGSGALGRADGGGRPVPRALRESTTAYIHQNAYHGLWRHAVEHYDALAVGARPRGVRP